MIAAKSDYHLLCHIARLVNEGFYEYGERLRRVPVTIGGTSYIPPIPVENDVKDHIVSLSQLEKSPVEVAIDLCLYCMKAQLFNDGNKRASVIFANHYLIGKGEGLLVIPESRVGEFKALLIAWYEGKDNLLIRDFMMEVCWREF
ncbi:MAG: Fic family protein [Sphaerochaetaceae bacterium]|mgnify:CR=1 FL=1|nr:Fic family protein [Sphaerochaetaceae bacterium]